MKKKTTGFVVTARDVTGTVSHLTKHDKFEDAVESAHAEGLHIPPGRRPWRQPEVFVREEFSDGSTDLVYYEFFLNDRPQHRA